VVYMASAEREPIAGIWGRSSQGLPRGKVSVRGEGQNPLELVAF